LLALLKSHTLRKLDQFKTNIDYVTIIICMYINTYDFQPISFLFHLLPG